MNDNRESILVEDLGPEENLCGLNPLPIDSPLLLVEVSDVGGSVNEPEYESVVTEYTVTPIESSQENLMGQNRPVQSATI